MFEYFLLIALLLFVYILYNNTKKYKTIKIQNEDDLESNYQPLINTWTPLTCDTYYQNCRPNYVYSDNYYYPI